MHVNPSKDEPIKKPIAEVKFGNMLKGKGKGKCKVSDYKSPSPSEEELEAKYPIIEKSVGQEESKTENATGWGQTQRKQKPYQPFPVERHATYRYDVNDVVHDSIEKPTDVVIAGPGPQEEHNPDGAMKGKLGPVDSRRRLRGGGDAVPARAAPSRTSQVYQGSRRTSSPTSPRRS